MFVCSLNLVFPSYVLINKMRKCLKKGLGRNIRIERETLPNYLFIYLYWIFILVLLVVIIGGNSSGVTWTQRPGKEKEK